MGNSSEYLRNFRRFVENTNEKIEVARAINRIVQEKHPETMLDVGAGDGTLTSILAPALREVYTVSSSLLSISNAYVPKISNRCISVTKL